MDKTTNSDVDLYKPIPKVCVLEHEGDVRQEHRFRGGSRYADGRPNEEITDSPSSCIRGELKSRTKRSDVCHIEYGEGP